MKNRLFCLILAGVFVGVNLYSGWNNPLDSSTFYSFLNLNSDQFPILFSFFSLGLTLIVLGLVNRIFNGLRLSHNKSNLTLLLAMIMLSAFPLCFGSLKLSIILLGVCYLIFNYSSLFGQSKPYSSCFLNGLVIGFVSLISVPFGLFVLLNYIGVSIFLTYSWRPYAITIIGQILPLYVLLMVYEILDIDLDYTSILMVKRTAFQSPEWLVVWFISGLTIMCIPPYLKTLNIQKSRIRKSLIFVMWTILIPIAVSIYTGVPEFTIISVPGLSIVLTNMFSIFTSKWLKDGILIIMVGFALFMLIN